MNMQEDILVAPEDIARSQQRFIVKVYGWMAAALAVTGLVAMYTASSEAMINFIFGGNHMVFYALIIGELLMVISLVGLVRKISGTAAVAIFFAYSILNGLT